MEESLQIKCLEKIKENNLPSHEMPMFLNDLIKNIHIVKNNDAQNETLRLIQWQFLAFPSIIAGAYASN